MDYELAMTWLKDNGLVYRIERVTKPGIPLKGYADNSAFKLFICDVGLLAAMGEDARRDRWLGRAARACNWRLGLHVIPNECEESTGNIVFVGSHAARSEKVSVGCNIG